MTHDFNHSQDYEPIFVNQEEFVVNARENRLSSKFINFLTLSSAFFHQMEASLWARINWKNNFPVPVLIEALQAEESEVRWHAAWVLSQIGNEAKVAVPTLIEALKDKEGEVRHRVAKTLWAMGSDIEIPPSVLLEALEDDERYVRRFATRTLAKHAQKR